MNNIPALLDRVRAERWSGTTRPPAPAAAIAAVDWWMRRRFGLPLPAALAGLWRLEDGVSYNGMTIYRPTQAAEPAWLYDVRSTNEVFGEVTGTRYLYVGQADMDAFVHDRQAGGWHMADKVSLDSYERFDSCGALLEAVLAKYLAM